MQHDWQKAVDLEVHAPPFTYNPSAWSQRIPISLLAALATAIAGYMALFQWGVITSVWDPFFGQGTANVLTSEAAQKMDRRRVGISQRGGIRSRGFFPPLAIQALDGDFVWY